MEMNVPFSFAPAGNVPKPAAVALSDNQIALFWRAVEGATGYRIYRQDSNGLFELMANLTTPQTAYTDSGLLPNTTYTYRVSSVIGSTESNLSDSVSATTLCAFAPSDHDGNENGEAVPPEDGGNGNGEAVPPEDGGNGNGEAVPPEDGGNGNGEAVPPEDGGNGNGEAVPPEDGVIPLPPMELIATAANATSINLAWTASGMPRVDRYVIHRSTELTENYSEIATVNGDVIDFLDIDLEPSTAYYYYVEAFGGDDYQRSELGEATTLPLQPSEPVTCNTFCWCALSGITCYRIYRRDTTTGLFAAVADTKDCCFTDCTAGKNKIYQYRVTAICGKTETTVYDCFV